MLTVEKVRDVGEIKQPTESELAPKLESSQATNIETSIQNTNPATGAGEWRE